jgi:HTH-type transcriptional regulator/antitoxin HipB
MASYPVRFSSQMREHLRALRKQRGLTQAQLGAQLGVSQARIAEIEANPGLVSFEQMLQLLSKLGGALLLEVDGRDSSLRFAHDVGQAALPKPVEARRTRSDPPRRAIPADEAPKVAQPLAPYHSNFKFNKKKGSW